MTSDSRWSYALAVFTDRQLLAIAFALSLFTHLFIYILTWLFGIDAVVSATFPVLVSIALLALIVYWWST